MKNSIFFHVFRSNFSQLSRKIYKKKKKNTPTVSPIRPVIYFFFFHWKSLKNSIYLRLILPAAGITLPNISTWIFNKKKDRVIMKKNLRSSSRSSLQGRQNSRGRSIAGWVVKYQLQSGGGPAGAELPVEVQQQRWDSWGVTKTFHNTNARRH